jgi:hypothetical protein
MWGLVPRAPASAKRHVGENKTNNTLNWEADNLKQCIHGKLRSVIANPYQLRSCATVLRRFTVLYASRGDHARAEESNTKRIAMPKIYTPNSVVGGV